MVQEYTPGRGPLFGSNVNKPKVPIHNAVEQRFAPRPGLTPLPQQNFPSSEESFFQKKKIILSVGVIFICLVVIAVVILMGGSYTQEVAEKSALFIPFLFKKK